MYAQRSKILTICEDCYHMHDMEKTMEFDMPLEETRDKQYNYRVWNPATEKYEQPQKANPLTLDQWQKILDDPANVATEDLVGAVMQGRNSLEPLPLVSGSRAGKAGK